VGRIGKVGAGSGRCVPSCGVCVLNSGVSSAELREVGAKSWKVSAVIWTVNGGCGGESRLWKETGEFCRVSAGLWRGRW
jgi:hypothetical protein